MATLFISDLHLDAARPHATEMFAAFVDGAARGAEALYILGDLFEAWVGDDDPSPVGALVAGRLRALADSGVAVFFMHGNRDFLVGPDFANRAGMTLLHDPSQLTLHGRGIALMHGDTLCIDDAQYQAFRRQTRHPDWQARFLAQPLSARRAFAEAARSASAQRQGALREAGTMEAITDVSPIAVAEAFARTGAAVLVHGHTHRPAIHHDGGRTRVVLGDWYEQGSVLHVDAHGMGLDALPA